MGLFAGKIFSKVGKIFGKNEGGFDGVFNADKTCCDNPKKTVFGWKRFTLQKDHGHSGVFGVDCCDKEDKEVALYGAERVGRD